MTTTMESAGTLPREEHLEILPREEHVDTLPRPDMSEEAPRITKVSIIVSRGSLEGVYPALIMANGARMEGIDANVFFTFFGLDAIRRTTVDHLKVATVGNPALHIPTMLGGLPGMSSFVTGRMQKEMEKLDIPPVREFLELISDSGGKLYACKASVDMFHLTSDDFIPQVDEVLTVGQFYELAAGGQIIFT
jgi:peroxiredoxin family protein